LLYYLLRLARDYESKMRAGMGEGGAGGRERGREGGRERG